MSRASSSAWTASPSPSTWMRPARRRRSCRIPGRSSIRASPPTAPPSPSSATGRCTSCAPTRRPRPALLAEADGDLESWGLADFVAAEELDRVRGLWWLAGSTAVLAEHVDESPVAIRWIADPAQPDREPHPHRYPAAGTANPVARLFRVAIDGARGEIDWDHEAYPYLATVQPDDDGGAVISVLSRDQQPAAHPGPVGRRQRATAGRAHVHAVDHDAGRRPVARIRRRAARDRREHRRRLLPAPRRRRAAHPRRPERHRARARRRRSHPRHRPARTPGPRRSTPSRPAS